jgi:hypothetical protein
MISCFLSTGLVVANCERNEWVEQLLAQELRCCGELPGGDCANHIILLLPWSWLWTL